MKIFPAIDLKDNKCVRLSKGKDESSKIFNVNPVDQAKYFEQQGCERIHIVDLDAAFGRKGINTKSIQNIRKNISIPIQMGGGIKSKEDIKFFFDLGIDYIIIGSFSINNVENILSISDEHKDKIYLSLDILNNKIMVKGWKEESNWSPADMFNNYNKSNIRGYVLTDIENDGMLSGLNIEIIKENIKKTSKQLIVGGGLNSYEDLRNLKDIKTSNLEGVIIGKSFYVGNIDLFKAQSILN